jgi:hypothetical protein
MKDLEGVGEVLLSSCTMLEKSEVSFDTMPSPATMFLTYDDEFWDFPLTSDGLYDYLLTSDYEFWDFSMISYDEPSYSVDRRYEPIFSSQKLQFSHTPKSRSAASLFQATW